MTGWLLISPLHSRTCFVSVCLIDWFLRKKSTDSMLTNTAIFNYFFQAEEGDSSNSKSGAVITSQPKILAKRYIVHITWQFYLLANPHNHRKPTSSGQQSLYFLCKNCSEFGEDTQNQSYYSRGIIIFKPLGQRDTHVSSELYMNFSNH